jgi:negative regulator of replication initiation
MKLNIEGIKTIYNFVIEFFKYKKEKTSIEISENKIREHQIKINDIKENKELVIRLKNSKEFQDFKEKIVNKFVSIQFDKILKSQNEKEVFEASRKIAGVVEIFEALDFSENIDIEFLNKKFKDNLETEKQLSEILNIENIFNFNTQNKK